MSTWLDRIKFEPHKDAFSGLKTYLLSVSQQKGYEVDEAIARGDDETFYDPLFQKLIKVYIQSFGLADSKTNNGRLEVNIDGNYSDARIGFVSALQNSLIHYKTSDDKKKLLFEGGRGGKISYRYTFSVEMIYKNWDSNHQVVILKRQIVREEVRKDGVRKRKKKRREEDAQEIIDDAKAAKRKQKEEEEQKEFDKANPPPTQLQKEGLAIGKTANIHDVVAARTKAAAASGDIEDLTGGYRKSSTSKRKRKKRKKKTKRKRKRKRKRKTRRKA